MDYLGRALELAGDREKAYLFMGRPALALGKTVEAQSMFARADQRPPRCSEERRALRLSTEWKQGGGTR